MGHNIGQLSTDREPKASTISSNMIKILATLFAVFHVTCGVPSRGYGHRLVHPFHGPPPCAKEEEVITVIKCSLVPEKTCSTETIVVGEKITGYEKGECKEVEAPCAPVLSNGYGCKKIVKEVCKSVPVKTEVTKDIESCSEVPKEVCEPVEKVVPKVTCKKVTGIKY